MFAKSWTRQNASRGGSIRWSRLLLLAIAIVMGIVLVVGVVLAAVVTVDTFNEGIQSLEVSSGIPVDSGFANHATILGGQRDAILTYTAGSGARINLDIDFDGTSNRLAYTSGDSMKGKAEIQWDGNADGGATALDADGLGGVDLTGGGTNDGFLVQVIFDDLAANLTFKVYTGTNWSQLTRSLPGRITATNRMDVFFPFNGFTTGGGTGAVFTSTGAVVLEIDGTVAAAVDLSLDLTESDSNREYGDLPASYGTAITTANHIPEALTLGANLDIETDGQPSIDAKGDDNNDLDDEDGVEPTMGVAWSPGTNGGSIDVTVVGCVGTCYLNGWIDWNGNNDLAGDQILDDYPISNELDQTITFVIPDGTDTTEVYFYARFRICDAIGECDNADTTDNNVSNGEVEDYRWYFGPTAVALTRLKATSALPRLPVHVAAAALALLVGSAAVGGVLVLRRRRLLRP